MPNEPLSGDRSAERVAYIRGRRTSMASLSDDFAPSAMIAILLEPLHVLRPEPTRVAVELVLTQRVTRDKMHEVTPSNQPEGDLPRRDPSPDHSDLFPTRRPRVEIRGKDMMHTSVLSGSPRGPRGLVTRADREDDAIGLAVST